MLCQRLNVFGIESNDPKYLRGLPSRVEDLQTPHIDHSKDGQTDTTTITVPDFFPPGSICLMKTWVEFYDESVDTFLRSDADKAMSELTLTDLNVLLYRCEGEERDLSKGQDGAYGVPGYGSLTYCGLQGWIYPLQFIIRDNDLAHAICNHLRNGYWALDYNVSRLRKFADYLPNLASAEKWLAERFKKVKTFPSFLTPKLFAIIIQTAYNAAKHRSLELLSETIRDGSEFIHDLALTSIQLQGIVNSTSLNPKNQVPCLAAGLPFFAYDYMRCWGRDIFISARGLFLGTGRYDDAKEHILAFAAMLKHGMIPNLLDAGRRPRYNSRDSVWFFLQLIQDYCKTAPDGISILSERVKRRFPLDDEFIWADNDKAYSYDSSIMEIVQEVLSRHANGLSFREAHAGFTLDSQMSDQGFNINIHVDWTNGMVFGGSRYNCGTWMDKMGESQKAGNKGVPGTPRDGASIEITGLLKSALRWVSELWEKKIWKWEGVTITGSIHSLTVLMARCRWIGKVRLL
jgi:glycogen debranching enzyme